MHAAARTVCLLRVGSVSGVWGVSGGVCAVTAAVTRRHSTALGVLSPCVSHCVWSLPRRGLATSGSDDSIDVVKENNGTVALTPEQTAHIQWSNPRSGSLFHCLSVSVSLCLCVSVSLSVNHSF